MINVTVTIERNGKDAVSCVLEGTGESKKGTFTIFAPKAETRDLPAFAKLYVKVKRSK